MLDNVRIIVHNKTLDCSGDGTTWEKKKRKTEAEMDGLCQPRHESHRQKMKSMTELAGGELCLPQRPHNQWLEEKAVILKGNFSNFILFHLNINLISSCTN